MLKLSCYLSAWMIFLYSVSLFYSYNLVYSQNPPANKNHITSFRSVLYKELWLWMRNIYTFNPPVYVCMCRDERKIWCGVSPYIIISFNVVFYTALYTFGVCPKRTHTHSEHECYSPFILTTALHFSPPAVQCHLTPPLTISLPVRNIKYKNPRTSFSTLPGLYDYDDDVC